MQNCYRIENTSNINKQQLRGCYMDPDYWKDFDKTVEDFKNTMITKIENNENYVVLRVGHSELTAFYKALGSENVAGIFIGRQSKYNTIEDDTVIKMFDSLNSSDVVCGQFGETLLIRAIKAYLEFYNKVKHDIIHKKEECLNFEKLYSITDHKYLTSLPLDIIYGLISNKWIFKTFKNRIGLIGSFKKLDIIKHLMTYKEYQDYLNIDYFTDYIGIVEIAALDDKELETKVIGGIERSNCDLFLIGCGVSKLKFYHLLKDHNKKCFYLDVGNGIDMIAGLGDNRRPYCGEWINYKSSKINLKYVDAIGHRTTPIKMLD